MEEFRMGGCDNIVKIDKDKKMKLRDKILVKKLVTNISGRNIYIWSCFMPNRTMFGQVSMKKGLITQEKYENEYLKTD